jgi:hypothetical protein
MMELLRNAAERQDRAGDHKRRRLSFIAGRALEDPVTLTDGNPASGCRSGRGSIDDRE